MVLVAVETVPTGSKPSAAVGVRISKVESYDFGAAAPLSSRELSLEQGESWKANEVITEAGRTCRAG